MTTYPFPPPPPFNTQAIVLHAVMLGLAILSVAGLWMTRKRVARKRDLLPWCFALLIGAVFGSMAIHSREEYTPFFLGYMVFVALVAGTGLTLTLGSLQRQDRVGCAGVSVMSILALGVTIAILLPGVPSAREAMRRTQCKGNLKQIGLAMHNWHDKFGRFPDAAASDANTGLPISWRVEILEFLNLSHVSHQYDKDQPWDSNANLPIAQQQISPYSCPSNHYPADDLGRFYTAYALMTGSPDTAFPEGRGLTRADFPSSSTTIMVGEVCGLNIVWTEPRDVDVGQQEMGVNLPGTKPRTSTGVLSGYHPGVVQAAFVDGSVRAFSQDIEPIVLKALLTRSSDDDPREF
ncbi:MAG: DUF1559 domain-containing protein [Planctomycetaceae bacterium]